MKSLNISFTRKDAVDLIYIRSDIDKIGISRPEKLNPTAPTSALPETARFLNGNILPFTDEMQEFTYELMTAFCPTIPETELIARHTYLYGSAVFICNDFGLDYCRDVVARRNLNGEIPRIIPMTCSHNHAKAILTSYARQPAWAIRTLDINANKAKWWEDVLECPQVIFTPTVSGLFRNDITKEVIDRFCHPFGWLNDRFRAPSFTDGGIGYLSVYDKDFPDRQNATKI